MSVKHCIVFFALIAVSLADLASFEKCAEFPDDVCEVSEVRITPCKNRKVCKFKKGTSPSISFDITPKFSTEKVKTGIFWASESGEVPFPDLFEADACPYTNCPFEANKKQEFNYGLKLSKKLPNGKYIFKWKIWNEDNLSQACCFKTTVELRK